LLLSPFSLLVPTGQGVQLRFEKKNLKTFSSN